MSKKQKVAQQPRAEKSFTDSKQNNVSGVSSVSQQNEIMKKEQIPGPVIKESPKPGISDFFSKARTIVFSIGTILLIIFLCWVGAKEIRTPTVYIEPFGVPDSFSTKGYSGSFLARRLIDNITKIRNDARLSLQKHLLRCSLGEQMPLPDVKISGTTVSLASVIQYLQATAHKSFKVTGDLLNLGEEIELTVRVMEKNPVTLRGQSKDFDSLLLSAAERVMKDFDPVTLGYYLYQKKRTQEALETINSTLHTLPVAQRGRAYALWGWILVDEKNFDAAASKFRTAAERDPKDDYLSLCLGWILYNFGKSDDAAEKFLEAKRLNPNSIDALYNLSVISEQKKDWVEAVKYIQEGLKINPDEAGLYYVWGVVLSRQGDHKQAVKKFKTGFEIDNNIGNLAEQDSFVIDNYVNFHTYWVDSLFRTGSYSDVVDRCDWALKLRDKDEILLGYRGCALLKLGKPAEAVKSLEKAIELGCKDQPVRDALEEAKKALQ